MQEIEERTGNEEIKYGIKLNNFQINLYKTLSKFENYDTINENKKFKLFFDFYLPLEIIKTVNFEKEKREIVYGRNDLKENTIREVEEELKKQLPQNANILNRYINTNEQDDSINVEIVYEVLENIGTNEKMIF